MAETAVVSRFGPVQPKTSEIVLPGENRVARPDLIKDQFDADWLVSHHQDLLAYKETLDPQERLSRVIHHGLVMAMDIRAHDDFKRNDQGQFVDIQVGRSSYAPSSWQNEVPRDGEQENRTSEARALLRTALVSLGVLEDFGLYQAETVTPYDKVCREKLPLEYAFEEVRLWRPSVENGPLHLAFNISLARLYSPDNLIRAGIIPEGKKEMAETISRLVLRFFEAQTGTLDMPATVVVPLSDKIDPSLQKRLSDWGELGEKAITRKDILQDLRLKETVELGFKAFYDARVVVKDRPGFTHRRDCSFADANLEKTARGCGPGTVIIAYAGMGAEGTGVRRDSDGKIVEAGWKFTVPRPHRVGNRERMLPNFSGRDYAIQAVTADDLYGLSADFLLIVNREHSMGGEQGSFRSAYESSRQVRSDRYLRALCQAVAGENWRVAYWRLPDVVKSLPFSVNVEENQSMFSSNIVFLRGLKGAAFGARWAAEGNQGHLSDLAYFIAANALRLVPDRLKELIKTVVTKAMETRVMLPETQARLHDAHLKTLDEDPEAAAAQAAGLTNELYLQDGLTRMAAMDNQLAFRAVTPKDAFIGFWESNQALAASIVESRRQVLSSLVARQADLTRTMTRLLAIERQQCPILVFSKQLGDSVDHYTRQVTTFQNFLEYGLMPFAFRYAQEVALFRQASPVYYNPRFLLSTFLSSFYKMVHKVAPQMVLSELTDQELGGRQFSDLDSFGRRWQELGDSEKKRRETFIAQVLRALGEQNREGQLVNDGGKILVGSVLGLTPEAIKKLSRRERNLKVKLRGIARSAEEHYQQVSSWPQTRDLLGFFVDRAYTLAEDL
ncbi:hypothetical protein ACFLZP_02130 [Patescibacteria group bacterium]